MTPSSQSSQPNQHFAYHPEQLADWAQQALECAQRAGATSAEVEVSESQGQNVGVRMGDIEQLEYTREQGLGVTVYIGQRKGHASTGNLSREAVQATVQAACDIARFTAEDAAAGLADKCYLATDCDTRPSLDLYHPWNLSVQEAVEYAQHMERSGQAVDARICNSEGASVSTGIYQFHYATSHGFSAGGQSSRHSLSTVLLAEDEHGTMQRDYWYAVARAAEDLASAEAVGRRAGERTIRRLGARRLTTRQAPVLFEPSLAADLLGSFVRAVSGGSLYRQASFLPDSLGTQVFAECVNIEENPFLPRGLASSYFDGDGVATHSRQLVENGVLNGYFLSAYSARKLGMRTTGNAGGTHNLLVRSTGESFDELLRKMDTGLLVTELLGQGINPVTGDYSRGAAGFWVEKGVIAYPVEEITIASNLKTMFRDIVAIGCDIEVRGSRQIGSVLISSMTIAGE